MEQIFLGLGSNVGSPRETIGAACKSLEKILDSPRISSLWRSKARYYRDQPDFVNAVVCGQCSLSPRELLHAVNAVEAEFGRDRSREIKKGPRPLDIDILLYGSHIIDEPDLIIPHAGLRERKFALLPLTELDPELVDPVSGRPYLAILASLPPQGIYLLDCPDYDLLYT